MAILLTSLMLTRAALLFLEVDFEQAKKLDKEHIVSKKKRGGGGKGKKGGRREIGGGAPT